MRLDIVIDTDTNTISVWNNSYYAEYCNVDFNSTTFQEIIDDAKEEESE